MIIDKDKIKNAVIKTLKVNMGAKRDDKIIILTDFPEINHIKILSEDELIDITQRCILAKSVSEIAKKEFNNVDFMIYPCTLKHGEEPPKWLLEALHRYDILIALTTFSLSHTRLRKELSSIGIRIASMPSFIKEMFYTKGAMSADYKLVKKETEKLEKIMDQGKQAVITSKEGTNLIININGRKSMADTGIYIKKGDFGNLPAGEVCLAPKNAEGMFIVPKGWYKGLTSNMKFIIKDGFVKKITGGGVVGFKFRDLLFGNNCKESRRVIAELGIGTNDYAKRIDLILEAEKIKGTVHIAIGDNTSYHGGTNESDMHEDFVIPKPTVKIDDKIIMKEGVLKIT